MTTNQCQGIKQKRHLYVQVMYLDNIIIVNRAKITMFATVTSVESIVYNLIHCFGVCSMPQPFLRVPFIPNANFFPFGSILLIQGWILNSSYLITITPHQNDIK